MAKTKTMTIQKRVESALLNGEALSKAIKNRFGAGNRCCNPSIKIQSIVFLNTNKRTGVKVYRTGKDQGYRRSWIQSNGKRRTIIIV